MSWWKAFIIGFCIYLIIGIISYILFVCFGLGYSFSNFANKFLKILEFPGGADKSYSIFLSMFFWTIVIAVVCKIISFFILKK